MKFITLIAAFLLSATLTGATFAETLETALLPTGAAPAVVGNASGCTLTNLGSAGMEVISVDFLDFDGNAVSSKTRECKCTGAGWLASCDVISGIVIPSGGSCGRYDANTQSDNIRCKWAFRGQKENVRSVLWIIDYSTVRQWVAEGR